MKKTLKNFELAIPFLLHYKMIKAMKDHTVCPNIDWRFFFFFLYKNKTGKNRKAILVGNSCDRA